MSAVPLYLAAIVVLVAIWEAVLPARQPTAPLASRWFGNFAVFGIGWVTLTLVPLLAGFGAAEFARERGIGVFNAIALPAWATFGLSFILLDLAGYWQHRLMHVAPFWRLHVLHHSDPDLDVSTAIRHHPLEVLFAAGFDALIAIAFGFPPLAIAVYGSITFAVQLLHHGNVNLPQDLQGLRWIVVTPEFHRLHHSRDAAENNSNFSNLCPVWDWLFGTQRFTHDGVLRLGLDSHSSPEQQRIDKMMLLPLVTPPRRTEHEVQRG